MIVKPNEIVAEGLEQGIYPLGTPVRFSAYSVADASGYEEPFMAPGVISGYQELGGFLVQIQRIDGETRRPLDVPPKLINTKCLAARRAAKTH